MLKSLTQVPERTLKAAANGSMQQYLQLLGPTAKTKTHLENYMTKLNYYFWLFKTSSNKTPFMQSTTN